MRRVEQQVIEQSHEHHRAIDALAFASKHLWNLANDQTRQAFIVQQRYLASAALYPTVKPTEANPRLARQSGQSRAAPTRPGLEVLF